MILDSYWHIFAGIFIAIIYPFISFFKYKEKPTIENFISLILSGTAIFYSFKILLNILNIQESSQLGIFKDDVHYIFIGMFAIVWVSTSTLIKTFSKLKKVELSQQDEKPKK